MKFTEWYDPSKAVLKSFLRKDDFVFWINLQWINTMQIGFHQHFQNFPSFAAQDYKSQSRILPLGSSCMRLNSWVLLMQLEWIYPSDNRPPLRGDGWLNSVFLSKITNKVVCFLRLFIDWSKKPRETTEQDRKEIKVSVLTLFWPTKLSKQACWMLMHIYIVCWILMHIYIA